MSKQYIVTGQDRLWKERYLLTLCKKHKMYSNFSPTRGQYMKCRACGYYRVVHGGDYG